MFFHLETIRDHFDYSQRAQWLRAVVLGGNEGLVATSVLAMALGPSFNHETEKETFIVTSLIRLVSGALAMAVSEFVSVHTQVDIMKSQACRDQRNGRKEDILLNVAVPSPTQIAVAASLAYAFAGTFPLLAVGLIGDYKTRFSVVAAVAALSMIVLGKFAAVLGKAPIVRSCVRVLAGGCLEVMILLGKKQLLEKFVL